MKVTKTQIKNLSKELGYSQTFIQHVFNQMTVGNPKADQVGMAELRKQMDWVSENNIVTTEMYDVKIQAIIEHIKKTSIGVPDKDEDDEIALKKMYKQLGYSNKEIRKVKIIEKHLRIQLKELITEFMSQAGVEGVDLKNEISIRGSETFEKIDQRWRNFARNYAIREYPKANTHKEIRTRLTGLFDTKLFQSLGNPKGEEDYPDAEIDNSEIKITQEWMDKHPHVEDRVSIGDTLEEGQRALDAFIEEVNETKGYTSNDQDRENDELNLGTPSV